MTPLIPLLLASLQAKAPPAEELNKRARLGGDLHVEADVVTVKDRRVQVGNCAYHLEEGIVLPIKAGRGEFQRNSGVVFDGKGTVTVRFDTRADAWAFANHMVIAGGADPEEMRDIAENGGSFTTSIKRGVMISTHADVNDLLIPARDAKAKRDEIFNYDMVMVVNDKRTAVPYLKAGAVLPNRVATLLAGGLDVRPRIAQEMLMTSWGGLPWDERLIVADFLSDESYGLTAGAQDKWLTCFKDAGGTMSLGEETTVFTHGVDSDQVYRRVRVTGQGYAEEKRIDPQTPGLRERTVDPVQAKVKVEARPVRLRKYIDVQVRSRLTFKANRDGAQMVVLNLPRFEARENTFKVNFIADRQGNELSWTSLNSDLFGTGSDQDVVAMVDGDTEASPNGAGAVSDVATGDGGLGTDAGANTDTVDGGIGSGDDQDGSGLALNTDPSNNFQDTWTDMSVDRSSVPYPVLILFDEPLEEGEEIDINMDWEAQWNFVQAASAGVGGEIKSLGPTTGFRNLLPDVWPTNGGTRWDHETTITAPSLYNFGMAATGETIRENWDSDMELMTITVRGEGDLRPGMAVGKWTTYEEPPAFGFPAVRIHVNPAEAYALDLLAPELRRVLGFYDRLMPEIEVDEFEIYQGRDMSFGARGRNEPGDGMLEINQIMGRGGGTGANTLYRNLDPYMDQTLLSRELGRRYWDGLVQPGGVREQWMSWVMPDVYSAFYVRGVQGTQAYFDWMETLRQYLEDQNDRQDYLGVPLRTVNSFGLTDNGTEGTQNGTGGLAQRYYGLYVMGNMLRYRVGENVYYKALDYMLMSRKDNFVTTEHFLTALEQFSGQELDDFFDFWVHGGFIPGVTVETVTTGDTVRGCVVSDVPFGKFDVPISVDDMDGFRRVGALVDVDHGHGQFEVSDRQDEVSVVVDPNGLILLTKREVKEVDSLDHCWREPEPEPEPAPPEPDPADEASASEPAEPPLGEPAIDEATAPTEPASPEELGDK